MDWQQFIYSPQNEVIDYMKKIIRSVIYDEDDADGALVHILDLWQKNNYKKLATYEGRQGAQPKTFLYSAVKNAARDYHRHLYGRCEAPTWVKKIGRFWTQIYVALCCEKQELEVLKVRYEQTHTHQDTEDIARTIKAKEPKCGSGRHADNVITDEFVADEEDHQSPIEQKLQSENTENMLHGLTLWLQSDGKQDARVLPDSYLDLLSVLNGVELDDEQIILLRLIHHENKKLPAAADFLGLKHHTARRKYADARERLQQAFRANGFEM